MNIDKIPQRMKDEERWIVWKKEERKGKLTKVPYQTTNKKAKADDPETWDTFENAYNASKLTHFDGLGFMLGDGYFGIDFDHVYDPEKGEYTDPFLEEMITKIAAYKEYSPSGDGVHLIMCCDDLEDREKFKRLRDHIQMGETGFRKDKEIPGKSKIEFYCKGRYFTVTGNQLDISEDISENLGLLNFYKYLEEMAKRFKFWKGVQIEAAPKGELILSDSELLDRAFQSKNGPQLQDMYNGNWKPYTKGDDSQSGVDLDFLNALAFWTGKDESQMKRIFKDSGLYREEKGESYIDITIDKAILGCDSVYDPSTPLDKCRTILAEAVNWGEQKNQSFPEHPNFSKIYNNLIENASYVKKSDLLELKKIIKDSKRVTKITIKDFEAGIKEFRQEKKQDYIQDALKSVDQDTTVFINTYDNMAGIQSKQPEDLYQEVLEKLASINNRDHKIFMRAGNWVRLQNNELIPIVRNMQFQSLLSQGLQWMVLDNDGTPKNLAKVPELSLIHI